METKEFYIDDYLRENNFNSEDDNYGEHGTAPVMSDPKTKFNSLCENIKLDFDREWEQEGTNYELLMDRHKKALIGFDKEVNFFKDKILQYIRDYDLYDVAFPDYYENLVDAIFHENWGFAGLAEWINCGRPELQNSTSAEVIGDRIFFFIGGRLVIQKQKISNDRQVQLRKALLLKTPEKRMKGGYAEVYMLDGTRIAIFTDAKTKENQESIIFRKYIVKDFTFEKQAQMGTYPAYAITLMKEWAKCGFNVAFVGQVRSTKTTQLTTWQLHELGHLKGVLIESDPEIPINKLMPDSPILQLVVDDEELLQMRKELVRADGNYMILAEARNGVALSIGLEIMDAGTHRVKMSYHTTNVLNLPYSMAEKVCNVTGGNIHSTIVSIMSSINYIFEYVQLEDNSKKRLNGIYEFRYDPVSYLMTIHQLCRYNYETDDWSWSYTMGPDKESLGRKESPEHFKIFNAELKKIAAAHPMDEVCYVPNYSVMNKN